MPRRRRARAAALGLVFLLAAAPITFAAEEGKPHSSGIIPKPSAPDPAPFTLQDRYFDSARRGDLEMLKVCLEKGQDVAARDEVGRSALALAVRDGHDLEMVEFLFTKGVPVDDPDGIGRSPLHEAAGSGSTAIVSWLLEHGASVDRKDMQGRTPLHGAVMVGSKASVVRLLEAKADINARDNFGDTPLIQACAKGLNEIARLLIEKGADPLMTDQEGRTAKQRADETATYCRDLPDKKPAP